MQINKYFIRLLQCIKRLEEINVVPGENRLSQTEFRLLAEVVIENDRGREIISSELARRLGITRSAVSQIVTKLEKRGVVQRFSSDSDRKIAYIRLSDDAAQTVAEYSSCVDEIMDLVIKEFGDERLRNLLSECEQLDETFEKILRKRRGEGRPRRQEGEPTC